MQPVGVRLRASSYVPQTEQFNLSNVGLVLLCQPPALLPSGGIEFGVNLSWNTKSLTGHSDSLSSS